MRRWHYLFLIGLLAPTIWYVELRGGNLLYHAVYALLEATVWNEPVSIEEMMYRVNTYHLTLSMVCEVIVLAMILSLVAGLAPFSPYRLRFVRAEAVSGSEQADKAEVFS